MAKKSAVEKPAELATTVTCDACGEEINLLLSHVQAVVKPRRAVIETVDAALAGAETDDEGNIVRLAVDVTANGDELDDDRYTQYLGYKLGAGALITVHNYECLADWAKGQISDNQTEDGAPIIRNLKVDPVVYGEEE